MYVAEALWLREGDRGRLEAITRASTVSAGVARRARVVLLAADGVSNTEIANDVVLNQVLVRFGDDDRTDAIIDTVQRDCTCWLGGTTWRDRRYLRISVSNWSTTESDVERSASAILRAAAAN